MELDEYGRMDATALADAVRAGRVSPAQSARLALRAMERVQDTIHAVAEAYREVPETLEGTLEPAPVATGPFAGVPFLYKDVGATQPGRRQELGSRLLQGRVVREESELARRFRHAGLVPIGRSTAPEFALSASTESRLHGATRNPWDPARSAGGSSGGAAAAVAAGVVPVAHGTDTAGSIRIPASACGLVGLKPSRGRVSHGPGAGEPFLGMDTQFALTRTVRDAARLLDAVAGPAPGDPFVIVPPPRPFAREVGAPVPRLRVAVAIDAWGGYRTDPEVAAATRDTAALLERMGHQVQQALPRLDYEAYLQAALTGWAAGFDRELDRHARAMGRRVDDATVEPVTMRLYEAAQRVTAHDLVRAEERFNRVRRDFGAFFGRFDVLLTPTLLRPPEPIGRYAQTVPHESFEHFFRLCDETSAFLPPFNLTGQPAVSLPLAWGPGGLPIGMQLVAGPAGESLLLRLAAALEEARPWADRMPPVHASRVAVPGAGSSSPTGVAGAGADLGDAAPPPAAPGHLSGKDPER